MPASQLLEYIAHDANQSLVYTHLDLDTVTHRTKLNARLMGVNPCEQLTVNVDPNGITYFTDCLKGGAIRTEGNSQ